MPKLPTATRAHIARCAMHEIMERLEQHIDAHPLRYGELPEEAYQALRERIEFAQLALLREIEIPPK